MRLWRNIKSFKHDIIGQRFVKRSQDAARATPYFGYGFWLQIISLKHFHYMLSLPGRVGEMPSGIPF
jgi:hypothetical protein